MLCVKVVVPPIALGVAGVDPNVTANALDGPAVQVLGTTVQLPEVAVAEYETVI